MKTNPLFRRQKLAHWQWQIEDCERRGWPPTENAIGGIEFYGRLHDEWRSDHTAEEDAAIEATIPALMQGWSDGQAEADAYLAEHGTWRGFATRGRT